MRPNLLTICMLLLGLAANAESISGKVVGIADGDTFTLLAEGDSQVNIRLAEIDAPEGGQTYGDRSKQALSDLIFGKLILVQIQTKDRYGRTVGRPYAGNLDICEEMVRLGAAWVYREYVIDQSLFKIENEAREAKRGLWALPEAQKVPPWNWRRGLDSTGDTPEGCLIKGNINSKGDKIYHAPGMSSYGVTQINEERGEKWFCREEDARTAGWRAPLG